MLDISQIQQEGKNFLREGPLRKYLDDRGSGSVFLVSVFTFLVGMFVILFRILTRGKKSKEKDIYAPFDPAFREFNQIDSCLKRIIEEKFSYSNTLHDYIHAECRLDRKDTLIVLFSGSKNFNSDKEKIILILEEVYSQVKPRHIKYVTPYYKICDESNFNTLPSSLRKSKSSNSKRERN